MKSQAQILYKKLKEIYGNEKIIQSKKDQEILFVSMITHNPYIIKLATEYLIGGKEQPILEVLWYLYRKGINIEIEAGFLMAECVAFWQEVPKELRDAVLKQDPECLYGSIAVIRGMSAKQIQDSIRKNLFSEKTGEETDQIIIEWIEELSKNEKETEKKDQQRVLFRKNL